MKIARWVLGTLAGLVLLAVIAVVVITTLVDPNVFKPRIESFVQSATGRPLRLEGDLELDFVPWLAVRTGAAQLGNPDGFDGPPLAQWRAARLGARLWPLLRGELVVGRIRFEGLEVHLHRTAAGRASWDGLLDGAGGGGTARWRPLAIGGLEIRDGALDYADATSGTQVRISAWQLEAGEWAPGVAVPLKTELALEYRGVAAATPRAARPAANAAAAADTTPGAAVDGLAPLQATLRLATRARIGTAADERELALRETRLRALAGGGALPAAGVPLELTVPALDLDLDPLRVQVPELSLLLANADVTGSIDAVHEPGRLLASGSAALTSPSLRELLAALGIDPPLTRDARALGAVRIESPWRYADGALAVPALAARLDDTRLTGTLGRTAAPRPLWQVELRGDRIDLDRYLPPAEAPGEPFELPVEWLRDLPVSGAVHLGQAQVAGATLEQVRIGLEHGAPAAPGRTVRAGAAAAEGAVVR